MSNILRKLSGKIYYSLASVKNRYPCKIIKVDHNKSSVKKTTKITFQAVNKTNIRKATVEELISDPILLEKFHPTDCVRMGFLSAGDLLFRSCSNIEECKKLYEKISLEILKD